MKDGGKVFGVGFQRTGTYSTMLALRRLGYRSKHFPAALWDDPGSEMLDRYDAFFDNPIPLLYRTLDERCPGSRFILTVRDVEEWLESCRWMFENRREEWGFDTDRRIREMHVALYGRNRFDREVFRRAYERHLDDVRSHFAGRMEDLLVLDITDGDPWGPLCRFLGRPRPDVPFPHKNSRTP